MFGAIKVSPNNSDGETHVITLSSAGSTSSLGSVAPVPPPAAYHSPRHAQEDQIAQFFGASRKSRSPPPYPTDVKHSLPTSSAEPATLARCMFMYGFLFPPFWFMGIVILTTELRMTPDFESGKSEDEKRRLLAEMRSVEVKWAKRCIYALLTLFTVILVIILAAVFAKRR